MDARNDASADHRARISRLATSNSGTSSALAMSTVSRPARHNSAMVMSSAAVMTRQLGLDNAIRITKRLRAPAAHDEPGKRNPRYEIFQCHLPWLANPFRPVSRS